MAEIEELLSLKTNPDGNCAEVRERASDKLAEVKAKIPELKRMRKALQTMIEACRLRFWIYNLSRFPLEES